MRKKVGIVKRMSCLLLIFLLSINSFAAIVSDNDGSAFITKAEFDALKSSFQAQIDSYNQSIDSKIDGAIASYLSGIKLSAEQEMNLMLWGGTTLGLVEDYRSHSYVDGKVGGKIVLDSWTSSSEQSYNGTTAQASNQADNTLNFTAYCYHELNNNGSDFKYFVVDYGKIGTTMIWDALGYADVTEQITAATRYTALVDYTNSGCYTIGLCNGWGSFVGTMGTEISKNSAEVLHCCETTDMTYSQNYLNTYTRGNSPGSTHNVFSIKGTDCTFISAYKYDNTKKYLTNYAAATTYVDVFPSKWYGCNSTTGHDSHTGKYDLYDMGWTLDESSTLKNFHIKYGGAHTKIYCCDNKAYMRKFTTGSVTVNDRQKGWEQRLTSASTNHLYFDQTKPRLLNLFKSNTGSNCTSSNLYSSEIGAAINSKLSSKCSTATINGQTKTVAPLYIGLPLGEVKQDDKVKITLDFLDSTSYEVGFYIDGFPSGTLSSSSAANAGCKIDGTTSHIQSVTGPATSKTITVDITKTGILFLKFGATTTSTKGTIKLPNTFTIVRET